jgi:hypothetical protein
VEQVIVADGEIEKIAGSDARWVVIVIFRAGRRNL